MITAVLTKFKRIEEIEAIRESLSNQPLITEILVRDNTVINLMSYGKYLLIPESKNEVIYTQDDDCVVNNLTELFSYYDGEQMINQLKSSHINLYDGKDSMMGWGAIFPKHSIRILDYYISKYGQDRVLWREADRIFTSLYPHRTIVADVTDFPSANADYALYKEPIHDLYKHKAITRATEIAKSL